MKKLLSVVALIAVLVLAACGGSDDKKDEATDGEDVTVKIGALSVPHAEILEKAQPILAEKGINLEIEAYEDYVLPNDDLADGALDANYFQHIPYLEQTVKDTGYELTHIGGVHIEPIAAYSQNIASIDEIADGTEVILSNSVADHGRVLQLFEANGLITLKDGVEEGKAELEDIEDNPKNLSFVPDFEPALLPEIYDSEADAVVVINTNYAINAGLDPVEDSIFREEDDSPYVNVIAVKEEDKGNEALATVLEVLRSEEIQNFIVDNYDGAVVPVSK